MEYIENSSEDLIHINLSKPDANKKIKDWESDIAKPLQLRTGNLLKKSF